MTHDHDAQVAAFGECATCAASIPVEEPEQPAVDPAAVAAWRAAAANALEAAARAKPYITADDVWARVAAPPEPRAMGAVFDRAAAANLIERTDRHEPSTRPEAHARPMRVWHSLVYEPPRLWSNP